MVVVVVVNGGLAGTERGSWRKGGKRRKQKAIAYERQLAPLMARETKQKSEASSSNTIKPTVCATSRSRGQKRGRGGREIKNREGTMAREPPRVVLPLLFAAVRRRCLCSSPPFPRSFLLFRCSLALFSLHFFFFFLFLSSCFSPLTTPCGNCFRVARENSLWKIKDR